MSTKPTTHTATRPFVLPAILGVAIAAAAATATSACGGPARARAPRAAAGPAPCYDGGLVAEEEPMAAAASDGGAATAAGAGGATTAPPYTGPMPIVQPSVMAGELAAVGLDLKNLPPFDKLDRRQLGRVMKTFSASLGIQCVGCHDTNDFKKPSPRRRVAKKMWDEIVRPLTLDDGSPLYCDSCHQGGVLLLDRRDKKLVADFMSDIMTDRLKRKSDKDNDCGTCHGDPPEFHFLTAWREGATP